MHSQHSYLRTLTLPVEERHGGAPTTFVELRESVRISGEGLLTLARGEQRPMSSRLQTTDGFYVDPWVVMLQVINHASEHREQTCSMLSALGITPPDRDGWSYGEATHALVPISK